MVIVYVSFKPKQRGCFPLAKTDPLLLERRSSDWYWPQTLQREMKRNCNNNLLNQNSPGQNCRYCCSDVYTADVFTQSGLWLCKTSRIFLGCSTKKHLKSAFTPRWNECFPHLLAPVSYKSLPLCRVLQSQMPTVGGERWRRTLGQREAEVSYVPGVFFRLSQCTSLNNVFSRFLTKVSRYNRGETTGGQRLKPTKASTDNDQWQLYKPSAFRECILKPSCTGFLFSGKRLHFGKLSLTEKIPWGPSYHLW